jgi:hypothetical protein
MTKAMVKIEVKAEVVKALVASRFDVVRVSSYLFNKRILNLICCCILLLVLFCGVRKPKVKKPKVAKPKENFYSHLYENSRIFIFFRRISLKNNKLFKHVYSNFEQIDHFYKKI